MAEPADTVETSVESRPFEADFAKLLHMMVHSVYSDKDVFLRELVSNAADACERLRYEAISHPQLLGEEFSPNITLTIDAEGRRLTVEDNGIGMSRDEMVEMDRVSIGCPPPLLLIVSVAEQKRRSAWRW